MTDAEISAAVETYFANHLDATYWAGLNSTIKAQVVSMAKSDVAIELPPSFRFDTLPDPETENVRPWKSDFTVGAIAEQAVFLARNYSSQTNGRVVQSQTLGELSQTFKYLSDGTLAPRAVNFIKRAKSVSARGVFIQRG